MELLKRILALTLLLNIAAAGRVPRDASESDLNPLCESPDQWPFIGSTLDDDCALDQVVDNFIQRNLKRLNLNKNDTGYTEAVTELKKKLKTVTPKRGVTIEVRGADLRAAYSYMSAGDTMHLAGILNMSWTDQRLSWTNFDKPKKDKFTIRSQENKIWLPDLGSQQHSEKKGRETVVHSDGKVEHHMSFWITGDCPKDMTAFPNDVHHCCADFQSDKYPDLIKFKLSDPKFQFEEDATTPKWIITPVKIVTVTDPENYQSLELCVDMERRSSVLTFLVICPLVASAILAIVIPLFSAWQMQILAKFTSLILQFICLVFISNIRDLRISYTVPKFVRLYDFVIWTTVVSVTVTTVLWALSRREKHALPPPHMLSLVAARINPFFCASAAPPPADSVTPESADHSPEWASVFLAINNLSLILFTIIYILGIIILAV